MKKFLLIAVSAIMTFATSAHASNIIRDSLRSEILGATVKCSVFLPDSYGQADRLYPVVYLLHGLYGTSEDWPSAGHMKDIVDELTHLGEIEEMVIIMPTAGDPDIHHVQNGYFNVPGWAYEDFFFQEFMPQIEARYNCIGDKQHRAIMGLSMGGGGSTVYAQRHPDCFACCYSMSGWLDEPGFDADMEHEPGDKFYYTAKSVREHSALDYVANADDATVEQLKTVRWFFDCGDDDWLMPLSTEIHIKMSQRGIKSELRVRDGWHSWEYWHIALRMSLPFASRAFGK